MESAVTFGPLNDYAMTFQFNDDNDRGFWWGDSAHSKAQGAMALSTRGWLSVAERIKVGGGQSDTANPSYQLHVIGTDTNANATYYTAVIDHNCSGGGTNTGDTSHMALLIDMDSSATGGTTGNEHRMYGVRADVRHSGDSDLVYGVSSYSRSDHTSGTTTLLKAGDFTAIASGTGINTNIYGIDAYALKDGGSSGTTAAMFGVRGEVEVDAGTCTNAYAFQSHIDRDGGTIATGYLYYGSYSGTVGTKWGIYLTGETKNYFSGDVGIGTTSPNRQLQIYGDSSNYFSFSPAEADDTSIVDNTNFGATSFRKQMMMRLNNRTWYWGIVNNASNCLGLGADGGGGNDPDIQCVFQTDGTFWTKNIRTSGNVGIGTTSPGYKLEVNGTSQFNGAMRWSLGNTSHAGYSTNKDWYIRSGNSSGKVILQDTGGNVGIGTSSPNVKLDVNGTIKATSYSNTQLAFKSYTITSISSATMTFGAESVALTQSVTIPDEIDISTPFSMQFTWYWLGEISGPSRGENFMFDIKVTPSGGSTTRLGQAQTGVRSYGITTHAINYNGDESSTPDTATITGTVTYNSLSTRTLSVQLIGIQEYAGNATLYTNRTVTDGNTVIYERGITTLGCIFYK